MFPPIQPYLFFEGRAEEALDFYAKAIGAEVDMLMRYKDSPDPPPPDCMPPDASKIMHASFKVGDAVVMASDGMCSGKPTFQGFGLSLPARDEKQADRYFAALGEGGTVVMPMGKTFFSPRFGMVTDKFGVMWMVIVPAPM
jgi:PhnB protein